jgi:hypothetical protein
MVELFCVSLSVFAALAVSHWIEHRTGWSIKKFERTARRYRTVSRTPNTYRCRTRTRLPRTSTVQDQHAHQCALA